MLWVGDTVWQWLPSPQRTWFDSSPGTPAGSHLQKHTEVHWSVCVWTVVCHLSEDGWMKHCGKSVVMTSVSNHGNNQHHILVHWKICWKSFVLSRASVRWGTRLGVMSWASGDPVTPGRRPCVWRSHHSRSRVCLPDPGAGASAEGWGGWDAAGGAADVGDGAGPSVAGGGETGGHFASSPAAERAG